MAAAVPPAPSWIRWCRRVVAVVLAGLSLYVAPVRATSGGTDAGRAGGSAARQRVDLVVGLRWREQAQLERLLRELSDPGSPRFGRYLSAAEFDARFGPTDATIEATRLLLRDHGLGVVDVSPSGLFMTASGWVVDVTATRNALLSSLRDLMQEVRLYFYLQVPATNGGGGAAGDGDVVLRPPLQLMTLIPRAAEAAFTPAAIARAYGFDTVYARGIDGQRARASTIAIATAYGFDAADLRAFWAESGVQRTDQDVELIWVGGETDTRHIETTVDAQWTSALAPASPVIVYAAPEPSAHGFLKVYDRITTDNRAAVMVTSWGACEKLLSLTYLEQAHIIFQRAAAQGMTVIAASGDRGADDCEDGELSVDFPASDPNVLAVGGTTLRNDGLYTHEQVWPGSGGGTSAVWAAPPWQMNGSRNRVLADVAFHSDPRPGFTTRFEGRALVVGGTSLAAPAWAALLSLANDARTSAGGETIGVAAPALCDAALVPSPSPFRDIVSGDNGGFSAVPGWDFPTGWGSPRVPALVEAIAGPAPAGLGAAASNGGIVLTPARGDLGGLRAQFLQRCGRSALRIQGRGLAAGDYVVSFNGEPVSSFNVGASGRSTLTVPGLDPRGGVISVTRAGAEIVFGGYFPVEREASTRVVVELASTGLDADATGLAVYQRRHGRERFTVGVRNVSPGVYDLRLGNVPLAPLTVPAGSSSARASFNVLGGSAPAPSTPVCNSITVLRDGATVLHAGRSARARDLCP